MEYFEKLQFNIISVLVNTSNSVHTTNLNINIQLLVAKLYLCWYLICNCRAVSICDCTSLRLLKPLSIQCIIQNFYTNENIEKMYFFKSQFHPYWLVKINCSDVFMFEKWIRSFWSLKLLLLIEELTKSLSIC